MTQNTSDRPNDPAFPLLTALAFVAFGLVLAGFFLSWGNETISSYEPITGTRFGMTRDYRGATAGSYGWTTLSLGILSILCLGGSLHPRCRGALRVLTLMLGLGGVYYLTAVLRGDETVRIYGSMSYAIQTGDLTLGYAIGPGLALLGFVAGSVVIILMLMKPFRI
jgi:hypothetical protein